MNTSIGFRIDGIATGATLTAAIQAIKTLDPYKVIVAAPVGAPDSVEQISKLADEVVVLSTPEHFSAVGQWYSFN
jgi:putative phosphoribosyl transferase